MRHRTKTLIKGKYYQLTKRVSPTTKKCVYTIHVGEAWRLPYDQQVALRAHFDPGENRGSSAGWTWKYRNKTDAEQLITMAILKWSRT
jgi:hypothetical protein